MDANPLVSRRGCYAPGERQPRHAHDEIHLTLVLRGGLVEQVGRRQEAASPLAVVFKGRGVEHADAFGHTAVDTFQVALRGEPGERLFRRDWDGPLPDWRWFHPGAASKAMLRLWQRWSTPGATPDPEAPELFDLLADLTEPGPPSREGSPPTWLARAREALVAASGPARVRDAAREAGVHPVSLARAFRRWYGMSVSGFLQQQRLQRAATLLNDVEIPFTRAAYLSGYADQAHLCRQFRAGTGLTPGAFRRLALAWHRRPSRPSG